MTDEFKIDLEKVKATTISQDNFMNTWLKGQETQTEWLKTALEEYANDGNFEAFFRALNYIIKARGRGAITKLAKDLNMDRSNLSNILNGKVKPSASTTFKLIKGLGYKIQIQSA